MSSGPAEAAPHPKKKPRRLNHFREKWIEEFRGIAKSHRVICLGKTLKVQHFNKMGIKGLFKIIDEHKDQVCTAPIRIKGKLIVDGYNVLHELYKKYKLEWASGGCYADQHKATIEFFNIMVDAGVEPIVVLEGSEVEPSNIDDTVQRRNGEINDIPGMLRKLHEDSDKDYRNHFLPILSRHAYKVSLNHVSNLQVVVADGRPHHTVVSLANHYGCPVLTNNTNYCVSELSGGVIFLQYFNISTCSAPVYELSRLIRFLKLPTHDLIFAIVAIMGENSKIPLLPLYHGRVRATIERICPAAKCSERPWIRNIADYLNVKQISSFNEFSLQVMKFNFGKKQCQDLADNCLTVKREFIPSSKTFSLETLMEMGPDLPVEIIKMYRQGKFPESVRSAIHLGKCTLDVFIGDPDQLPVSWLGLQVRQAMYGLAMPLMERAYWRSIEEYYRSDESNKTDMPWEYSAHGVQLKKMWPYENLLSNKIFLSEVVKVKREAKMAIYEVLNCPHNTLDHFTNELDSPYMLAIMTTYNWARHPDRRFNLPEQLLCSLVLNFFTHTEDEEQKFQQSLFYNPSWFKVYHALLQWQALYRDVCGLNDMLLSPFLELPPTNIINSSFVIRLALHPDESLIFSYQARITKEQKLLYDKIVFFCKC